MSSQYILEMNHIEKEFFGNKVLKDVSLRVKPGDIVALIGENGAGKSTIMNILFGMPSIHQTGGFKGEVLIDGEKVNIKSPMEAMKHGIGMVHQEFMLIDGYDVAENIKLNRENTKKTPASVLFGKRLDLVDQKAMHQEARQTLDSLGIDLSDKTRVGSLPVGYKQFVEIARELDKKHTRLIVLDEPTAVLTEKEAEQFLACVRSVAQRGIAFIFISHKLDEVKRNADHIFILRDGEMVGDYNTDELSTIRMSELMVGREVAHSFEKEAAKCGDVVMRVRDLTVYNSQGVLKVDGLSFDLRGGEILGIAGVEGNGQSELIDTLNGINKKYKGTIRIKDADIQRMSIKDVRNLKVAHIPEDRMVSGCAGTLSILENLFSNQYDRPEYSGKMLLKRKAIEKRSNELIEEYKVKCRSNKQAVGMLSGGNIQKVIVAREFSSAPDIIIANQPTRGIDVGATEFIRQRLLEFRNAGCAVILVSADLNEIFALSDRLAVMYKGKFSGVFTDVSAVTEEELGRYMLGLEHAEKLEGAIYE